MSGAQGNKLFLTFVPTAGIAITALGLSYSSELDPSLIEKIPYIPYLIILGVMIMGIFFSRHRVTFISAVFGISYALIHNIIITDITDADKITLGLISILLPLNIALITGLKEQQLLSIQGISTVSIILIQLVLSYWGIQNYAGVISTGVFYTPEAIANYLPETLSLTIIISFIISTIIALIHIIKKGTVFEFSFAGALVATYLYFLSGMQAPTDAIYIITASLIMAWGLIHNSYLIAYIDELTELPGRRAMNEESSRLRGLYAIAMLDIDHFKKFNDTYGHDVGVQVLRMVASKIGRIGGGGKAFRYGGEEFAVIFPGKDSKAAFPYLSNLRETIDHASLILRNQDRPSQKPDKLPPQKIPWQEVHVTISIGVADSSEDLESTDEILKAADDALYRSKEKGRNRISQFSTKDYSPDIEDDLI